MAMGRVTRYQEMSLPQNSDVDRSSQGLESVGLANTPCRALADKLPGRAGGRPHSNLHRIEGITRTHFHASLDIFQSRLDGCTDR